MRSWKIIFSGFTGAWLLALGASTASAYDQAQSNQVVQALANLPHPQKVTDFDSAAHLSCRNQWNTEICWSFASSSFLESERARLKMQPVRISVLYPEYCEFLEKAKRFIAYQGKSRFVPGDLFTGVTDTCRLYGAMPAELYDQMDGQVYDQDKLYSELEHWIEHAKAQKVWDEIIQLGEIKGILNKYLGEPPATFAFNGKTYTPRTFFDEVVQLKLSDYVLVTSWNYAPFNQFMEMKVPDNWKHNTNYFNVPLAVFYDSIKDALQAGYTVASDVDVTEPSYHVTRRFCFSSTNAPADQASREAGYLSGATTDDHLIHLLAWKDFSGDDWFLAKDSSHSIWAAHNDGYVFAQGSYVKLKFLAFLVHKDAVPQIRALLPGL